LSWVPNFMGAL